MNLIKWVEIPNLGDERGALVVAEAGKNLSIDIKRVYFICGTQPDVPRGFHAHHALKQVAFCIQGKCRMIMDNGHHKEEVWLDSPNKGLLIPPLIWHEIHDFSEDCILLVFADDYYSEADYIRSYNDFLNKVNQ